MGWSLPTKREKSPELLASLYSAETDKILKKEILNKVNLFCYGQVESPYGSGQFIKDLNENFDEDDSLVVSEIKGKEAIMESIRDFLGKGK